MAANEKLSADLLIDNIQRYIPLSEDEKQFIHSICIIKHLSRGSHLLEEGTVCRYDAFVLDGSLKGYMVNGATGKEEILFLAITDWWACALESFHN
jgi:CRP-like cAMP-binding protein